jgi:hypothetical protein
MLLGVLHLTTCAALALVLFGLWLIWRGREADDEIDREYRELVASIHPR